MLNLFQMAAGTSGGRKHRRARQNNQDSILAFTSAHLKTIVIADGVSAAPESYLASGSQVHWLTQLAHEHAASGQSFTDATWEHFAEEFGNRIRLMAAWSPFDLKEYITRVFSSTVGGLFLTDTHLHLVAFGDVRFVLNGDLIVMETADPEKNAPALPSYLVTPSTLPEDEVRFKVASYSIGDVQHALVATDGIDEYIEVIGKTIKGRPEQETVPPLEYFWTDNTHFNDPDDLTLLLDYVCADHAANGVVGLAGRVYDDISIGAMRRIPAPPAAPQESVPEE